MDINEVWAWFIKHPEWGGSIVLTLSNILFWQWYRLLPSVRMNRALDKAILKFGGEGNVPEANAYEEMHKQRLFANVTGAMLARDARNRLQKRIDDGKLTVADVRLAAPYLTSCEVTGGVTTVRWLFFVEIVNGIMGSLMLVYFFVLARAINPVNAKMLMLQIGFLLFLFFVAYMNSRAVQQCKKAREIVKGVKPLQPCATSQRDVR